jgi:hypothetical protein
MRFIGGENSNATEVSHKTSRLVAESGKIILLLRK